MPGKIKRNFASAQVSKDTAATEITQKRGNDWATIPQFTTAYAPKYGFRQYGQPLQNTKVITPRQ
jgi:hypothetical protein